MHKLCFFALVAIFGLALSREPDGPDGQDGPPALGSSNQQAMLGDGFMAHKSSDGKVHSIGSDASGSFMHNQKSKRNVHVMGTDDSGNSIMINSKAPEEVDDLDLRNIDISESFEFDVPQDRNKRHVAPSHGTVVVTGGNGADAKGGADGADKSVQARFVNEERRR